MSAAAYSEAPRWLDVIAEDLAQHAERVVAAIRGDRASVAPADLLLLAAQCQEVSADLLPERSDRLLDFDIVDSFSRKGRVSTKPGQLQHALSARDDG